MAAVNSLNSVFYLSYKPTQGYDTELVKKVQSSSKVLKKLYLSNLMLLHQIIKKVNSPICIL